MNIVAIYACLNLIIPMYSSITIYSLLHNWSNYWSSIAVYAMDIVAINARLNLIIPIYSSITHYTQFTT